MAVSRPYSRRSRRAAIAAAFLLLGDAGPGSADDSSVSALIFGSLDAGPSGFGSVGAKLGFDRIDRDGFAVMASAGTGRRTETGSPTAASPSLVRWTMLGAAVVGYQWFHDWGVTALYAGPEASAEVLSGSGGTQTLPVRIGLRLHGEVWAHPSEETLLTATLILGSSRGHAWGRLSYGVRLWGAYLGPETALYVEENGYAKGSLGLHATDLAMGGVSLRVSAGYLIETGRAGGSPYVALTLWRPL